MDKIILFGVRLYNNDNSLSKKAYDFKNSCDFKIKKGDEVIVKIGTGGTTEGVVEYIKEKNKEPGVRYKNIVEVVDLKVKQEELIEGNSYICDIRIWRNQWSSEGGYNEQWSDLTIKCLYNTNNQLEIGDIVEYEGGKAKVVNLRQIPASKTKKLKYITIKDKKIENSKTSNNRSIVSNGNNIISQNNSEKIQEFIETPYNKHIKFMFAAVFFIIISFVFIPFLMVAVILLLVSLICMIKNWKRINREYKIRKSRKL